MDAARFPTADGSLMTQMELYYALTDWDAMRTRLAPLVDSILSERQDCWNASWPTNFKSVFIDNGVL